MGWVLIALLVGFVLGVGSLWELMKHGHVTPPEINQR